VADLGEVEADLWVRPSQADGQHRATGVAVLTGKLSSLHNADRLAAASRTAILLAA